jgi:hypothetical protein
MSQFEFFPQIVIVNLGLDAYPNPDWISIQHRPDPDSDSVHVFYLPGEMKMFSDVLCTIRNPLSIV